MRSLIFYVTLCAFQVNGNRNSEGCYGCRSNEYFRIKRGKYFSNPPTKFYDRPPYSPAIKGPFSYTPPPGYTSNDIGPPHSSNTRPYKVSKRPADEGLGDENIHNIIKYLSKKDLNRLVDLAMESKRNFGAYRETPEYKPQGLNNDFSGNRNTKYGPDAKPEQNKPHNLEDNKNANYFTNSHQVLVQHPSINAQFSQPDFAMQQQLSFLDAHVQKEINEGSPETIHIYTDGETMQEEKLPGTSYVRSNDFDTSFTNNIPQVIKLQSSYEIKNFADLPLMDFENSKLDKVNSYKVPHYSVTSFKQPSVPSLPSLPNSPPTPSLLLPLSSSSSSIKTPEVEMAPPASAVQDQSEAHLKAIKIWTHKSKGTAYTLHDDGTLTLERPSKPSMKQT